jgi:hypothetical protein
MAASGTRASIPVGTANFRTEPKDSPNSFGACLPPSIGLGRTKNAPSAPVGTAAATWPSCRHFKVSFYFFRHFKVSFYFFIEQRRIANCRRKQIVIQSELERRSSAGAC